MIDYPSRYRAGRLPLVMALAGLAGVVAPAAAGVSASYLDAVRAEYREVSTGAFELPPGSPWVRAEVAASGADSAEYGAFEAMLRRKMAGTYIQFKRLPAARQQEMFREYVEHGDLARVRRQILDTLKH